MSRDFIFFLIGAIVASVLYSVTCNRIVHKKIVETKFVMMGGKL